MFYEQHINEQFEVLLFKISFYLYWLGCYTSGINVTLITHSPFVLSDIPAENILCLSRKKEDTLEGKTFAANIHDLFNNTFFLPFTVGEIAKSEISEIVKLYNDWAKNRLKSNGWKLDDSALEEKLEQRWPKMEYVASIVGDEYLSEELTDMLDEMRVCIEGCENK